jgi:glyoxylase-like metal-dependent hydrolase (beta-lactamase superfamily II)
VSEIGAGVHRLGGKWLNWYVVEDDGGLTVVDSGLPDYWDQLEDALRGLGRRLDDVAAVVLTHNHDDHTGLAGRLHKAAGARVLVHEADAAVVRGDVKGKPIPGFLASATHRTFLAYIAHVVRNGGAKRIVPSRTSSPSATVMSSTCPAGRR